MAITYGYFCEDIAIELFVEETLKALGPKTKCKSFIKDEHFWNRFHAIPGRNREQTIAKYKEVAEVAILDRGLDFFIAAYDFDKTNIEDHKNLLDNQKKTLDIRTRSKSVFCVPIQCIEYWLWYVKHFDDDITPLPNSLESDPSYTRDRIKSDVYQRPLDEKGKYPKQSARTEVEKARPILAQLDIDRLKELSPSFAHFVKQIEQFCNVHG